MALIGAFVEASIIQTKGKKTWLVQIPIQSFVAIADLSEGKNGPGFLADIQ